LEAQVAKERLRRREETAFRRHVVAAREFHDDTAVADGLAVSAPALAAATLDDASSILGRRSSDAGVAEHLRPRLSASASLEAMGATPSAGMSPRARKNVARAGSSSTSGPDSEVAASELMEVHSATMPDPLSGGRSAQQSSRAEEWAEDLECYVEDRKAAILRGKVFRMLHSGIALDAGARDLRLDEGDLRQLDSILPRIEGRGERAVGNPAQQRALRRRFRELAAPRPWLAGVACL